MTRRSMNTWVRPTWLVGAAVFSVGIYLLPITAQEGDNRPDSAADSSREGVLLDAAPGEDPAASGDVEVVLRGPLHEAFASHILFDPRPGIVISTQPPDPIEEIPPEIRPADESSLWIPGYWAWDDDRNDFLWVSGGWRVPPPDRTWVPGYWSEVREGYQWISGFWALADGESVEYLPYPPESLEAGPTSVAPGADYYWVSGCWRYRGGRYGWSPGYWGYYQPGWAYVPSYYVWTPRGAVFVNGYWDYPLINVGQPFASVYFRNRYFARPGYRYSPTVALNLGRVTMHLFVGPRSPWYYWGNYYGSQYSNAGYRPWFQAHGQNGFDPGFVYYQRQYQSRGIDYAQRLRGWNSYFERHQDFRPAATLTAQAELSSHVQTNQEVQQALLSNPIRELMQDTRISRGFRQFPMEQRQAAAENVKQFRDFERQRIEVESGPAASTSETQPGKVDVQVDQNQPRLNIPQLPGLGGRRGPDRQNLPDQPVRFDGRSDRGREGRAPAETQPKDDSRGQRRDTSDTPQPERPNVPDVPPVETPSVPDVEKPSVPNVPDVEEPKLPNVPRVEKSEAPDVEKPNAPGIPDVEKPNVPNVPRVEKSDAPEVEKRRTPNAPDEEQRNPPNVEKRNEPNLPEVDRRNVPNQPDVEKQDEPNAPGLKKRNVPNIPQEEKRNVPNVPQVEKRNTPNVEKRNEPNVPEVDRRNVPNQPEVEKRNESNSSGMKKRNVPNVPQEGKRRVPSIPQVEKQNVPNVPQVEKRVPNVPQVERSPNSGKSAPRSNTPKKGSNSRSRGNKKGSAPSVSLPNLPGLP